ncbi:MAG: TnpV protein [Oscillospiraceae bacterium]|nr:MAG: TnpV protein [Oscillospiraceae bacterium]
MVWYKNYLQYSIAKQKRQALFNEILSQLDGILLCHLSEINVAACEQIETLTKQLAKQAGASTALKLHKPLEWTAQMQAFHAQAEEIVCAELIFF